jgi:hypothetical protein
MSAMPVLEPAVEPTLTAARTIYLNDTATVPVVVPRRRARSKTKTVDLAALLGASVSFIIIAGLTCFAASLIGNVMVEKARRDGIRSMERARFAARESAALREQVQALTSPKAIDDWAKANGFVAAGFDSRPSGH